jgi:hypothetical protein
MDGLLGVSDLVTMAESHVIPTRRGDMNCVRMVRRHTDDRRDPATTSFLIPEPVAQWTS